ncbi:alpha/beta hydrolase [Enterobacteriaceae bacterium 4M9]|nr:alpha/beta hydrolase [Enterobacteriaceae bacterium 4M9]
MRAWYSAMLGGNVRYHDLPGDEPPVVFIHGLGCASSYDYPCIARDPIFPNQRVLLIDLPGSGFSDKPAGFSYTTTALAHVLDAMLQDLAPDGCYLFGHSMGGSIAIELATMRPERVRGLVVSEPNLHGGGATFSRGIASLDESSFVSGIYPTLATNDASPWSGSVAATAPHALWREARSLVKGVTPSWREQLSTLEMPRAVLFGALSLPDNDYDTLAQNGVETYVVSQAGHSMAWENPHGTAAAIGFFIRLWTEMK